MRAILCLILFGWFAGAGRAQQTVVVTSSAGAGGLGRFSDGTAWPTAGGYFFDVGVFPAGFDPAAAERVAWIAAWQSVRRTNVAGAVSTWFRDGASDYFSITGSSALLHAGAAPGTQYYVWGYNARTVAASTEWILLTNPAWRVVAAETPRLPDQLDTKDPGTFAVVGSMSSDGADLASERIFGPVLTIVSQVTNFSVSSGQAATVSVSVRGSGLSFQWYAGEKGDTTAPIAGATRASYTVGALVATARFWVRISNGTQSVDSETVTVSAGGGAAGVASHRHAVDLGYIPGQRARVRQQISYSGTLSRLHLSVLLPAGWSFVSSDEPAAQLRPAAGSPEFLEWSWSPVPASPFTFDYVVSVPAGASGEQPVTTLATATRDGVAHQSLVQPEPLRLREGARLHTADRNRDNQLDLFELTRVIELYNTRSGTERTGAYRVDAAGEDGFAADPTRGATGAAILTAYHTADVNPRDGRIDLFELTRVIELYNTRSGTTRTGAYYARGDTEDGFVAGPSPVP